MTSDCKRDLQYRMALSVGLFSYCAAAKMSLNQTLEGVAHTVSHPAGLVHKLLRDAHGSGGHIAHGIDDRVHVCTSYLPQLYISVYISILMNLFGIYHIYPLRGGQVVLCVGLVGVLAACIACFPSTTV